MSTHKTNEQRFWSFVDKSRGEDGCWIWTGGKNRNGYGQFRADNKMIYSHRYVLSLTGAIFPENYCVLHKCDKPSCVNPKHLYLGTHTENMQDRLKRTGTTFLKGEKNGYAKLTEAQVVEILELIKCKPQIIVAKLFKVSTYTISLIALNKSWKHIPR